MIDSLTVTLMLLAALLHASWHSLVKYRDDQNVVLAGMGLVAAVIALPAISFLPLPPLAVWPVIAGSVLLHVGYKLALARSYVLGDLGQAYPLARGFVPVLSTAIAYLFLSQFPTANQLMGITVVSAGLLWLALHSMHAGVDRRLFLAAATVGFIVASYSVVDAYGTRISGNWASFTAWLIVIDSLTFSGLIYAIKGQELWTSIWRHRGRMLVSGSLGIVSFSVFLWALSRSPVGPVSALRESSVLFATLIGAVMHRESKSIHKMAGAGLLMAGLIIVAAMR